jgi:hypothetical protein
MPDLGISNFGSLRLEPMLDDSGRVKQEWLRAFINLDASVTGLSSPPTSTIETRVQAIADGSDAAKAAIATRALAALAADPSLAQLLNDLQSLGVLR